MKERKPDGGLAEWIETLEAMGGEDDGEMLCLLLELRRFREDKPAIIERLEAAEAQVKELTADLDKESEIRHRIHEELNAIKGEQQPVGAFHIFGGEVEATSDYVEPGDWPFNDGIVEVYAHPAPARPVVVLKGGSLKSDGDIWYKSETVVQLIRAAGLEVKL